MKLKPEQLSQHLQQGLQPAYLVSGDEPLIVQECCDQIRAVAREQEFFERDLFHADGNFDWGQINAASQSMSLFAEKRIIEIRVSNKLNDQGRKALIEATERPEPDNLLLIVLPKLDSSSTKAKWFKTLESQVCHIQIWPLERSRLPQWIKQRLSALGFDIEPEAMQLLADKVDGNLLAAKQELEKLALLSDQPTITTDLVLQAVLDSARYTPFDLSDACLLGETARAIKVLNGLEGEGIESPIVLWALSRELRSLATLHQQLSTGANPGAAHKKLGIWDRRKPLFQAALNRLSANDVQELLLLCGRIDAAIKGQRQSDVWSDLSALTFSFAAGLQAHLIPA